MATITGTNNGETLTGTSDADVIEGLGGDDTIYGLGGDDTMLGGAGNDTMFVDSAGDSIVELSGEGYDIVAAISSWTLTAGAHVELLTTGWIDGTTIIALNGNEFAQQIWGNAAANTLSGGDGNDTLFGFGGDDILIGGAGNDEMFGGGGIDDLVGGLGNDTYFIDDVGDDIDEFAGQGYDVVAVGFDYTLPAGSIELLTTGWIGGTAAIDLMGSSFGNEIWGNDGDNVLHGGFGGDDALFGFGGNDRLEGGQGYDILSGGSGQDIFYFGEQSSSGISSDIIVDFNSADDTIELAQSWFGLAEAATPLTGVLKANTFVVGTAAGDADDRIIYNQTTGQVFLDPDGTGNSVGHVILLLSPGTVLTAADFIIV